jgi:hypothetical protein
LQDVALSVPLVQAAVLWAMRAKHQEIVRRALQPPQPGRTFASLDYYVDAASAQTLKFAALAALSWHLQADELLAPSQLLPVVSRVLLQTEEVQANKYLEAVAAALGAQMNAGQDPAWAGLVTCTGMAVAAGGSCSWGAARTAAVAAAEDGGTLGI